MTTIIQELIDTHCHLDMGAFEGDIDAVLKRAADANILHIINIGSDREGNIKGLSIARKYQNIYSSVGIHPHDAKTFDELTHSEVRRWIKEPKVVAVGEIGLDYHYMYSSKEAQIEAFKKQIALARDSGLPVIIHSREAEDDTMKILRQEAGDIAGVLHCFAGDIKTAEEAMELGFFISIAGPVTFKKADRLREVAKNIPDERLLIETDAPYLSPEPMRGKRNEPAFLKYTAEAVAKIRGVKLEDIARITTLNAKSLFRIGVIPEKGEIAYRIRNSLYLNVTSRCTNSCGFCVRFNTNFVKGHNLKLDKEPSAEELIKAIRNPDRYKEIVFCGLGEPMLRLDVVKEVSAWVKQKGGRVRINTNGHGNLIHKRNIIPELSGIVDSLSISLDADDAVKYEQVCKPAFTDAFNGVISFIKEAKNIIPEVTVTVVAIPEIDIDKCRAIAEELGVELRVREFNAVG
ncbi:MAG: YchF/TatD family DNA exonuclease [Nitrospirae bacterium]|nr:YchF/TatD family DNA exonuclease [Nitrospirota bacterium]